MLYPAAEQEASQCCTRKSDMLEAASILGDAVDVSLRGHELALSVGLTPERVMEALESDVMRTGDMTTGK